MPRFFFAEHGNMFTACLFFFSSRRRHTICSRDWSSDVCSSDLASGGRHHDLGRARRYDVFLDKHLDAVRHWLEESERSDAIWPVAILHAAENFSLQHGNQCKEREKHTEQRENVDEARGDLDRPVRRASQRREKQLLPTDEDLVKRIAHLP